MSSAPAGPGSPGAPPDAGRPRRASVARNATVLGVATVVARLATFGLAVAMGRVLGAAEYGTYGLAAAIATVVVPLADLGLTPYLIREVARRGGGARGTVMACVRAKALATAATFAVGAGVVAIASPPGDLAAALLLVLAAYLADSVSQFAFGFFQGRETMGLEAALTSATSLARSAGGVALVLVTGELEPVLAWIAVTSLAQLGWAAARMRRVLRDEPAVADGGPPIVWSSVIAMGLVTVFAMVYLRADSVIIGAYESEAQVGWYTAAYTLMAALQLLPWMVAVALGPVFARTYAADRGAFVRAWHDGARTVLLLALPLATVVCLLADPIVRRLFGAEFDPAGAALAILVWSTPVWAGNMLIAGALRGAGQERVLTAATGAGAALNVGLNLWVIPRHGIEGAAAVTVATEAGVLLALVVVGMMRGIVPLPAVPLAGPALALGALAACAVVLGDAPVEVALVTSLAAYCAVLAATGTVGRADVAAAVRAVRR